MRFLITGVTGFAGSHLAEFLLASIPGAEVFGTRRATSDLGNLAGVKDRLCLLEADFRDSSAVQRVVEEARPDFVFHLAARSEVASSWAKPAETLTTNLVSQVHLFEAIRKLDLQPAIQVACSSDEYGAVRPDEQPVTESNELRPLSPYAVSKVGQDMLAYQYFRTHGLATVRTRAFNHTGPRRSERFVASSFARQIAMIESGQQTPVLRVGNLDVVRDFTDVRDVVRAYWLAAERGEAGDVYNVASGRPVRIRELLELLMELAEVEVEVELDPARFRPADVEMVVGDSRKLERRTGWRPEIPLRQTLSDLLEYWRHDVGRREVVGSAG